MPRCGPRRAAPASIAALEGITGIGAKKREAYGDAVLAVIAAHASRRRRTERGERAHNAPWSAASHV
jgi:hypothetical protein